MEAKGDPDESHYSIAFAFEQKVKSESTFSRLGAVIIQLPLYSDFIFHSIIIMPYSNAAETGDFEKLQKAFSDILSTFGSVDNLLDAFGLSTLPSAQRYGIVFGCFVFVGTVTAVLTLLVLGGSFHRMAEQTKTGAVTIAHDFKARLDRPLLLERLLDARTRMMQRNYPNSRQRKEGLTNLTSMLLNVAPPPKGKSAKDDETGYMRNFVVAYRKCQDKPGGTCRVIKEGNVVTVV